MSIKEILLLGHPKLYQISEPLKREKWSDRSPIVQHLHDTLFHFRNRQGAGRAIVAVQIGVLKRLIDMHLDQPIVFINPSLDLKSKEKIIVWDEGRLFRIFWSK